MVKAFTTILCLICFVSNAFAENLNNLFAFHQVKTSKKYEKVVTVKNKTTKITYKVDDKLFFRDISKNEFSNISINSETEKKENFIENYTKNIPNWVIVTGSVIALSGAVAVAYSKRNELNTFRNASLGQSFPMNNSVNETPKISKGRKLSLEFKF